MNSAYSISAVPTNIITGFLGAGKTSAILSLLKAKPSEQRWAILVNEFGEIGVDQSLFSGEHSENDGVYIREVPGGCMCCAAGLPMQIALNQLLARAKPQRLLIEPTGLGHPKEVLEVLSAEHYRTILDLQKIITLVDARKIVDKRYTENNTFNQQIAIADTIVGNKVDLYGPDDKANLARYVNENTGQEKNILFTQHGELDITCLEGKTAAKAHKKHEHPHSESNELAFETAIPSCGYIKALNQGEGFYSVGWRFAADKVFNHEALYAWINSLKVERAKGVFITTTGIYAYNITTDSITEVEFDDCLESRLEVIGPEPDLVKENELLACLAVS